MYGYCNSTEGNVEFDKLGNPIPKRNCKFVINICECPAACEIKKGEKVGIQMEILTPGVFWVNNGQDINTVSFSMYNANIQEACGDVNPINGTFKDIKYYESFNRVTNVSNHVGYQPVNERKLLAGPWPLLTNVPAGVNGNRVQALQSEISGDYMLQDPEVVAKRCLWVIDIPPMILDSTATRGATIQVKVRLLWNREQDDMLCKGCVAADICECVRDVGIVCCDVKANNTGCLFFPYVLQGLKDLPEDQSGGWVSGVAISAVPVNAATTLALPEGAYCKLTLRDTDGNTATWQNNDLGKGLVWAFVLDTILPKFSKALKPGACSLLVETNYPIDGYTFMNANMQFGAGTLPRGCYGAIAPGSN